MAKPGGGYFLAEEHHGGHATRLRLIEIGWGRLVDVHDVDARGRTNPVPVLRDFVINENVLGDGVDTTMETNPITHATRLVVHRPRDAPDTGTGTFSSILNSSTGFLSAVLPKNDDGTATLPVSVVSRDAAIVLRFDDLLEDGPDARATVLEAVRLGSGYPPVVPQPARIVFDPSHGGIAGGAFHSTRVLIDCAVSERDTLDTPYHVPINAAGLPASAPASPQPNASLHFPTRLDPANGRFDLITNLAGRALESIAPIDPSNGDIVRAFRTGNRDDSNGGFLLDLLRPNIVGTWPIVIESAQDDPDVLTGFGFVVDLTFQTPCKAAPRIGDTLELAGDLYEVREEGGNPGDDGRVLGVRLLRLDEQPLAQADLLLGAGSYATPYIPAAQVDPACWLTFVPPPREPPSTGIESGASIRLRFNEPMDADSFRAFDTFRALRGSQNDDDILAADLVVGAIRVGQSLQEFTLVPRLPFANVGDLGYRIEVVGGPLGLRDLSGSELVDSFQRASFELAPGQPPERNSGFGLRFEDRDELLPAGPPDFRGQMTYDETNGVLRPRVAGVSSYYANRSTPLVNLMQAWGFGVQSPLSPLGSKVQMVWRYCDFGFRVRDENYYNLDVTGLSWSPLGGTLVADLFPEFEIRLGHAICLPDETILASAAPKYPLSGLFAAPRLFIENVLDAGATGMTVVHSRSFGYQVRPSDMTRGPGGTPLMPFPWNHSGAPFTSYTWRDTTVLVKAGLQSPGSPLDVENGPPLNLDNTGIGSFASTGQLRSVALPLLWEIRCYPTTSGLGLNSLDILLPVPGFPQPNFRAYSTGGIDSAGRLVLKDPDQELVPTGGFNPSSVPPGLPTALNADNSFYAGSIDTVIRVSRAVSIWIDTGTVDPHFVEPVIEPRNQLGKSSILVEYRGADAFTGDVGNAPFDATQLDTYGDFPVGAFVAHPSEQWSSDITAVNGARFIQLRFSFLNDIDAGLSPELDSFGVAFEN